MKKIFFVFLMILATVASARDIWSQNDFDPRINSAGNLRFYAQVHFSEAYLYQVCLERDGVEVTSTEWSKEEKSSIQMEIGPWNVFTPGQYTVRVKYKMDGEKKWRSFVYGTVCH